MVAIRRPRRIVSTILNLAGKKKSTAEASIFPQIPELVILSLILRDGRCSAEQTEDIRRKYTSVHI